MTRKILTIILPIFILVFASTAHAQVTSGSARNTIEATTKLKQQNQLLQEQKRATMPGAINNIKTAIQLKRDEFKLQLQTIKDQKKKALIERIDAKLAEVNKNQTTKYKEALTRMQGFLTKKSQSITDPKLIAEIILAQNAIDAVNALVKTQEEKVYTITITDDATLKLNAGATISQLRHDLNATYAQVMNVKQMIQKLNIGNNLIQKEATESAK